MEELNSSVIYNDDGTVSTFLLDLLTSEASLVFDGHALVNLKIDKQYDYLLHSMKYRIHTMIPAENMKEETHTVSVEYPDGWWNAFKEKYFPKYILHRFPVKYVTKKDTVRFTAYMLYPKFPRVMRGSSERQFILKNVYEERN